MAYKNPMSYTKKEMQYMEAHDPHFPGNNPVDKGMMAEPRGRKGGSKSRDIPNSKSRFSINNIKVRKSGNMIPKMGNSHSTPSILNKKSKGDLYKLLGR